MCSTPKGSGKSRPIERFHDEPDYASYSAMLRRASRRMDRKEQQLEEQRTDAHDHNSQRDE